MAEAAALPFSCWAAASGVEPISSESLGGGLGDGGDDVCGGGGPEGGVKFKVTADSEGHRGAVEADRYLCSVGRHFLHSPDFCWNLFTPPEKKTVRHVDAAEGRIRVHSKEEGSLLAALPDFVYRHVFNGCISSPLLQTFNAPKH